MKKKRFKKIITWTIVVVILIVIGFIGYKFISSDDNQTLDGGTTLTKRTAPVLLGDVGQTISASGPLEASEMTNYRISTPGELVILNINDGDFVKKGELLASLSTTDLDEVLENYESQIENTKENIDTVNDDILDLNENISDVYESISEKQDDIATLQSEINDHINSKSDLTIYSPISGIVFDIRVDTGDVINNGTILATISDTNIYEVELAISAKILEGVIQSNYVYYKNTRYDGLLVSYADYTYINKFGKELVDVVLQFTMESGIPTGDKVRAIITVDNISYSSDTDKVPYYAISENIVSSLQGEIISLNLFTKKLVNEGDVLAILDPSYIDDKIELLNNQIDSLNDQIESYYSQIDSYNDQINSKNSLISDYEENIESIQQSIDNLQDDYDALQVIADYNGIITNINVSIGDMITTNTTLFTLIKMDAPEISISIDELDIARVKIGMDATVVIDALGSTLKTPALAKVTNISLVGQSQGGVTTFDVTVALEENVEGLMLAMNATATIFIDNSINTLYVPIEAITMMGGVSYVYVETGGTEIPITPSSTTGTSRGKGVGFDTSNMTEEELKAIKEKRDAAGITESDIAKIETTAKSLQEYYIGTSLIEVTTGVYNESFIEILNGVKEGQVVVLPPTYTTEDTDTANPSSIFGDSSTRIPGMGSGGGKQ
ncbi:MAG: HlyD family efflux transporter periplasmic adaptor subunit [Clostridiales bacterium]|nr:HlyD family efflux transporter periplasmic adaptor subunit [Clostridiales bacterium]